MVERSGWLTSLCEERKYLARRTKMSRVVSPPHAKSIELKVPRTRKTRTYPSLGLVAMQVCMPKRLNVLQEALQLMQGVQLT